MKYRQKPLVIEAVQWEATRESWNAVLAMGNFSWKHGERGSETFRIVTPEGDRLVRKNDFIIKDVTGEFYPCKPDIFEKLYEPVEDNCSEKGNHYGIKTLPVR